MIRTNDRVLPLSVKAAFGIGQFAEGLKTTAFSLFVLFYYNQILGLSGTLAGLALFVALTFDAVTDPLAGSVSDNFKSRLGRRHPFMYASAVPLALAFVGLFSPPEHLDQLQLFLWLATFAVLTRGAMTFCHVPHLALGAELTDNAQERTRIVASRQFFSTAGGASASVIGLGYFFSDAAGGRLAVDNYTDYAITLGVLMVAAIWFSAWGTQKEVPFLSQPAEKSAKGIFPRVVSDTAESFSNRPFRWLFFGELIIYVMAGVNGALDLYMYQYFWELSGGEMLSLQVSVVIGLLLGAFLTPALQRLTSKKFCLFMGAAAWAFFQLLPVSLRLLDVFPANGTSSLIIALIAMKFLQGILLQQAMVAFGSMMADVVDEHELVTGVRQEGIFFGAISFSAKATSGFGALIGGLALDIISWPRGPHVQTAADIPTETLFHLGVLYGPVVSAFAIVACWCYAKYPLTEAKHAEILRTLYEKRQ